VLVGLASYIYQTFLCWSYGKNKLESAQNRKEFQKSWKSCFFSLIIAMTTSVIAILLQTVGTVAISRGYEFHEVLIAIACFVLMISAREVVKMFENLRGFIILVIQDPLLSTPAMQLPETLKMMNLNSIPSKAAQGNIHELETRDLKDQKARDLTSTRLA
jgi:ABC-type glycerol-3-phosphate transport system permease component